MRRTTVVRLFEFDEERVDPVFSVARGRAGGSRLSWRGVALVRLSVVDLRRDVAVGQVQLAVEQRQRRKESRRARVS